MANTDQSSSSSWFNAFDTVTNPSNYDSAGTVFTDWYLPSASELRLLCEVVSSVPALATDYWSATQGNNLDSIEVTMRTCPAFTPNPRTVASHESAVRAIRSF